MRHVLALVLTLWPLTTRAEDLTVFAAASLREPFEELGLALEKSTPGLIVRFNFAGSQELRAQIEHGAQADVFASADRKHMAALEKLSLVAGPRIFARNQPVVVVPKGNPASVRAFADLPKARRLVIGAPEVPIGAYTLQILDKAGRHDLSVVEQAEIKVLEEYLPAAASEDDIRKAIEEAVQETGASSIKDMGKVMKAALGRLTGKSADGSRVSQLVKEKLS